jgi:hypothetical protein
LPSRLTNVFHEDFKNEYPVGQNLSYYNVDLLPQILVIIFLLNSTFLVRMPFLHPELLDLFHVLRLLDNAILNDFLLVVKLFLDVLIQLSITFDDILIKLLGNHFAILIL